MSEKVEVKASPADTSDKTAPAEVTNLEVKAANVNAVLTWTNPGDSDFNGVKISMSHAEGTLANAVTLDKNAMIFTVSGLTNGTEYTFKVQSFDKDFNYSSGSTAKITPVYSEDSMAPENVKSLSVVCANGKDGTVNAVLSWEDPADKDLFGMEITYAKITSGRSAIAAMSKTSIFAAPENCGAVITNLTAGKLIVLL